MPGLHILHKGSEKPGFWYSHDPARTPKKLFIKGTISAHVANCCREMVQVNGEEVMREIPASDLICTYGDSLGKDDEGHPKVVNGETVDAVKVAGS